MNFSINNISGNGTADKGQQQHQRLLHQKYLKQHHSATETPGLNDNNQKVVTTSNSSNSLAVNILTLEIGLSQQPIVWRLGDNSQFPETVVWSSWKWKGAYFVALFFPEYVRDQAVKLAFSSFGKSSFCLLKHFNLLEWWFASVCTEHYDKNLCLHPKIKLPSQRMVSVKLRNRVFTTGCPVSLHSL